MEERKNMGKPSDPGSPGKQQITWRWWWSQCFDAVGWVDGKGIWLPNKPALINHNVVFLRISHKLKFHT